MKKTQVINSDIFRVISQMGHFDTLSVLSRRDQDSKPNPAKSDQRTFPKNRARLYPTC